MDGLRKSWRPHLKEKRSLRGVPEGGGIRTWANAKNDQNQEQEYADDRTRLEEQRATKRRGGTEGVNQKLEKKINIENGPRQLAGKKIAWQKNESCEGRKTKC